jgi:hypothetical protein
VSLKSREVNISEVESDKLAEFRRYQLRWLAAAHLLDRPWFIFASAPNPTLPTNLPKDCAHVYINFSGQEAKARKMPSADLILIKRKRRAEQLRGLRAARVIQVSQYQLDVDRYRLLQRLCRYRLPMMRVSKPERKRLAHGIIGDVFSGVGDDGNLSNGAILVLYAILMGVPQIILAGFSVTKNGHSHTNDLTRFRMHKEEDSECFKFVAANYDHVSTTEMDLHNSTGLRLWGDEQNAPQC